MNYNQPTYKAIAKICRFVEKKITPNKKPWISAPPVVINELNALKVKFNLEQSVFEKIVTQYYECLVNNRSELRMGRRYKLFNEILENISPLVEDPYKITHKIIRIADPIVQTVANIPMTTCVGELVLIYRKECSELVLSHKDNKLYMTRQYGSAWLERGDLYVHPIIVSYNKIEDGDLVYDTERKIIITFQRDENTNEGYVTYCLQKILALSINIKSSDLQNIISNKIQENKELRLECYRRGINTEGIDSDLSGGIIVHPKDYYCVKFDTYGFVNILPIKESYQVDPEFEKHTGFLTHEEFAAYEKGREDEEKTITDWIEKWDGSTNSAMGDLLIKKFTQIKNKL
jgi:hypothetical protein